MATIKPLPVDTNSPQRKQTNLLRVFLWENVTENDICEALELPDHSDKTIQVTGSFGGGSISIEGSLMRETPTYHVLNDPNGNALTLSAGIMETVLENVWKIRPKTPTGVAVDIDVHILVK